MKPSSTIKSAHYDQANRTLHITFHGGGTYHYPNVTPEEWNAFDNAPSAGKHFHRHLRSKEAKKVAV